MYNISYLPLCENGYNIEAGHGCGSRFINYFIAFVAMCRMHSTAVGLGQICIAVVLVNKSLKTRVVRTDNAVVKVWK